MSEKTFKLEIVTPQKIVFDDLVESFTAPGTLGSFQVLYNHASLLSSIVIGQVKIVGKRGDVLHYATSGGFVEVRENHVVALAETAERSDKIDVERARAARDRALKRLAQKKAEIDLARARAALARALNRLKAAGRE